MLSFSTTLKKAMLNATGLKGIMDSGFIYIFASTAGVAPTSADTALDMSGTHTLLGKVSANAGGSTGITFTSATTGTISKASAETWSTGSMTFSGAQSATTPLTAVFYRHCEAGDNGQGADNGTSTARVQGLIGTLLPSDMIVASTSLASGTAFGPLTAYQIQLPG